MAGKRRKYEDCPVVECEFGFVKVGQNGKSRIEKCPVCKGTGKVPVDEDDDE